ncbi:zymogen granule membrane protein 16-like [Acanthochromis polyacanthus]|uniref:Zymogen granule membrane protein 16-like n=1 Tax=Acanthochromis polyacanthus TaxID=80966 RepID=A0A3Q1ETV8_9TELE|nr:zymogen granule membrane protein 16-like [Acanthochromis polyacanthus]
MFSLSLIVLLCASCLAKSLEVKYSFSKAVGGGSGTSFSTEGPGGIRAVRVWEISSAYITGIQLKNSSHWSPLVGKKVGTALEINLFDGETISQISGKYHTNYIYQVIFVTSRGRLLVAGQPTQSSFNFYPHHPKAELKMLSGRFNGHGITSLAAHWAAAYSKK